MRMDNPMRSKTTFAWFTVILSMLACDISVNWTSTPEPVSTQEALTSSETESPLTQPPPASTSGGPAISNCPLFPANNILNARVDTLPIHPSSDAWIDNIGRGEIFHMDF